MSSILKKMSNPWEIICKCMLMKLSKNFDEAEYHKEYEIRNRNIIQNYHLVNKVIEEVDLSHDSEDTKRILASLILLHKEWQSEGPWKSKDSSTYADKLNTNFLLIHNIELNKLLSKGPYSQDLFDKCLEYLQQKFNGEDFKKYPSLLEVYISLIMDLKDYNVEINPVRVFPASLLLVDDHMNNTKIKGLQCTLAILQCMTEEHFKNGNYYAIVYDSLKRALINKDMEITSLVLASLQKLILHLTIEVKSNILDDVFLLILEELATESNLYRKGKCLNFATYIIQLHGINCSKWKIFKTVVLDTLEICCNDGVHEILLEDLLQCFAEWIKHCWCGWEFKSDYKIISALFKVLYVCKDSQVSNIQDILLTLINISSKDGQVTIFSEFKKAVLVMDDIEYLNRVKFIINRDMCMIKI